MRKYKELKNGIIVSVGEGARNGITISDSEYETILLTIQSKPTAPDGYGYRLRTDLTWEMYEMPEQTEDEQKHGYTEEDLATMTNAELEQILYGLGITASMNKANMIRLILAAQEEALP